MPAKEDDRMAFRKPGRQVTRDNELLQPTPTSDYTDPGAPRGRARKAKIYTSGTLHEKETGNYYSEGILDIPGADESKNKRPVGHGKKETTGKAAPIRRGAKVAGAQRGVGQPTVDGFINGLTGRNTHTTRRK